jgi:hypothetical protein
MGAVAPMPEAGPGGPPATTVFYATTAPHLPGGAVLKWANDLGYQGLVQVMAFIAIHGWSDLAMRERRRAQELDPQAERGETLNGT